MKKYNSLEEAEEHARELRKDISQLISEDLLLASGDTVDIDFWYEKFGNDRTKKDKSELINDLEMDLIDARLFIEHNRDKRRKTLYAD